jgi:8-oxo-dGTP pyrophosphatase MutT (NUDIX family)
VIGEPPAQEAPVARARPAATVLLARDAQEGGIEIYLVQRHSAIGFMGGMHVFPGGKVCADDASDSMRGCIDARHDVANDELWGADVEAGAAFTRAIAAIRETLEEAGVLLGIGAPPSELNAVRERLLAGETFPALLAEHRLSLELSVLQPFSRWITPESEPVRFDTSFYLARAPLDQEAACDRSESVSGMWIAPAAALEAARTAQIRLAPPTALTLESLKAAASVDAAWALATSRPPPVILPIMRAQAGEFVIVYPGDPEHPVRTPAMDGPTRRIWRKS